MLAACSVTGARAGQASQRLGRGLLPVGADRPGCHLLVCAVAVPRPWRARGTPVAALSGLGSTAAAPAARQSSGASEAASSPDSQGPTPPTPQLAPPSFWDKCKGVPGERRVLRLLYPLFSHNTHTLMLPPPPAPHLTVTQMKSAHQHHP